MYRNEQIIELTNMILTNAIQHEHKKRDLGVGFPLHSSQLRFIDTIHGNPEINITDLASILGISKSAVSKMTSKLRHLGLVERFQSAENQKDVLVRLTAQGEMVYERFKQTYRNVFFEINDRLSGYGQDEKATILRFLRGFNEFIIKMESLTNWPEE